MLLFLLVYMFIIQLQGGADMPQIVPMKELRNTNEISEMCHAKQEPIFVTKNGCVI